MRIAVNTRFLNKNNSDGISRYTFETLSRLTSGHPEHQFIFFFDRAFDKEIIYGENVTPVVIGFPARHPFLWFMWFEFAITKALEKYKADLFFSPDGFMSLRTKVPSFIVIHDINFFHRPKDLPLLSRIYYNYFFPRFARKARMISTVSKFSKRDIASAYNIEMSKIEVNYNGVTTDFRPSDDTEKKIVKDKFTAGKPFFIFIGNIHPRKNLINLLKAYDHFRSGSGKEIKMVIIGEKLFMNKDLNKVYQDLVFHKDVIFTGYLNTDELIRLLSSAEALTFVPYFEGFGLPILEAMMCDVPVITSNVTSLPEIAGDAAIYADPSDYLSISEAMKLLIFTPGKKNDLIQKGRIQSEKFSWHKTTEGLWETIQNIEKQNA